MSRPATPTDATKAAKTLVGSFANLRPDQPDVFIASIAAVLAGYPLGVVQEAVDPRRGLARKVEFLSIKSLSDWCDERMKFHNTLAGYEERPKLPERPDLSDDQRGRGLAAWLGLQRTLNEHGPEAAKVLTFDAAVSLGVELVERGEGTAAPRLQTFKPYSDDDLRAKYPSDEAAA